MSLAMDVDMDVEDEVVAEMDVYLNSHDLNL